MAEKWKLGAHQELAIAVMDANDSLLLAYGCGCGKTAIALTWILKALKRGDIPDALIVCPASLVVNWKDSIDKMIMFEGVSDDDVTLLREHTYITSFQKTYKMTKREIKHRDGRTSTKKEYCLREEVDKRWGCTVIDEAHGIGAHDSVQTKTCLQLARLSKHRFAMSATPFHGGGGAQDFSKLFGIGNFLEPGTWPTWTGFCASMILTFDPWHKPSKYRVDLCEEWVKDHGISCRIEDCFDMPAKMTRMIPCPLKESKVYKDIQSGRILQYGFDVTVAGAQYIKLMQICSGSLKISDDETRVIGCSKDDVVKDIISGMDRKMVIFCNFRASLDRCKAISEKLGRKTVIYDGRSKTDTWKELQFGDAEVLICQYQSGGSGLDLDASAYTLFYEPCTSAINFEQAHGRIYRPNQCFPCTYTYLYTPNTIEEHILKTVMSGKDASNKMLQKWSEELY